MKKILTALCMVVTGLMAHAQWNIPLNNGTMETSSTLNMVEFGGATPKNRNYQFTGGQIFVQSAAVTDDQLDVANSGFAAGEGINGGQAFKLTTQNIPNPNPNGWRVQFQTSEIDISAFGTGQYTFTFNVKSATLPTGTGPLFHTVLQVPAYSEATVVSRAWPDVTALTSYQKMSITVNVTDATQTKLRLNVQSAIEANTYYFDDISLTFNDIAIWNGTEWVNTASSTTPPTAANKYTTINGNLTISSDIAVDNLQVNSGTLTIGSGASLAIAGTSTGSATVMRNTTGNGGYSMVGAPVSGANLSALSADYLYTWNGSAWSTPTGSMTPGMGYFAGYDAATPTVSLTGTLVSGDQTVAVTTAGDGFNLVANPYAAAISITNFLSESSNSTIDGSVYFWNDGGTNNGSLRGGDYVTVNAAGNVSNIVLTDGQNGQNTSASNTHIGSMQGFFVHATSDGNITFKPTMQTSTAGTNADANYYRQASENQSKLKLSLSGDHYSEVLFAFRADGTLGWDRHLDALHKTSNETFAFYSLLGEKRFSIQGLPELLDTEIIKLGYDLETAGEYVLSLNKFENISDNYRVVANHQGESFDITGNDAVLNLAAGRGEIELTITNTRVLSAEIQSELSVYNRDGLLKIQMNESLDKASIQIIDIQGRSHFYAKNEQLVKGQWSKNVNLHSGQLYVLRIESKNGVFTKKFIY